MAGEGLDPLVQAHMAATGKSIDEIKSSIVKITDALVTLVRLESEQRTHAASIANIQEDATDHDRRLKAIEVVIPVLKQTHSWVVAGVIGIVAMVGVQVYSVLTTPRPLVNFPAITQPISPP